MSPLTTRQLLGNTQLERVGNTPLVRLQRIAAGLNGIQILGKAEWVNPGGSVKDRPAFNIVREAERNGQLLAGRTLLD
ncbi:MAG TPA: pyridoxal-phosphate dependent enzyme, partial [Terriglobales bacterium]|nr:pyridoxal-phosphate dependent enzyme [Terriglobales bacterium]